MKKEEFFNIIGEVDEQKVATAGMAMTTKKNSRPIWLKWVAIAACLCLIAIATIWCPQHNSVVPPELSLSTSEPTLPIEESLAPHSGSVQDGQMFSLLSYLNDLNIPAQTLDTVQFVSGINRPKILKEDLLNSMKQNTTVQGKISRAETVSVQDGDSTWYITTMNLVVDEVLTGSIDSDEVSIVFAVVTSEASANQVASPYGISGYLEGTEGVFILRALDDVSWNIVGKEVLPIDLGKYGLSLYLDREGDALIFREQNVEVQIDELQ